MCNLYSHTRNIDAIKRLFKAVNSNVGNLPSMPGIFPDTGRLSCAAMTRAARSQCCVGACLHPRKRNSTSRPNALTRCAKGKDVDFNELLRLEPDSGTTNIRNTSSKHWQRWLGVENRCVVPFTSFSEFHGSTMENVWFAADASRPLLAFAGIWTNWTSVRKVKTGVETVSHRTLREVMLKVHRLPNCSHLPL